MTMSVPSPMYTGASLPTFRLPANQEPVLELGQPIGTLSDETKRSNDRPPRYQLGDRPSRSGVATRAQ